MRECTAIRASDIDEPWDRRQYLHVFRANAAEMVTVASVEKMLDRWFATVGVARVAWQLGAVERAPAKNWSIAFSGPEATAARKAQRASGSLKTPGGTLRRLAAASTAGDEVALYVYDDKLPMQGRVKDTVRKLQRAVQEVAPMVQTRQLCCEGVLSAACRRPMRLRTDAPRTCAGTPTRWQKQASFGPRWRPPTTARRRTERQHLSRGLPIHSVVCGLAVLT